MTVLLLDVGNTFTKWRLQEGEHIRDFGRFLTSDLLVQIELLIPSMPRIKLIAASWVGKGEHQEKLVEYSNSLGVSIYFAESQFEQCGLTNGYLNPKSLGVDRWLAMLGVWCKTKSSFCVVDAGTAMTIDFVDAFGHHSGGYIIPGVRTMISALNAGTFLIECLTDLADMGAINPGRRTQEAVERGALMALIGSLNFSVQTFRADSDLKPSLIIGGGDAGIIFPHLGEGWQRSHELVLDGLSAAIENRAMNIPSLLKNI